MSYQFESACSDAGTDFYAEPRDRGTGPRFRGLLVSFVAVLSVAAFAGGLWFAYQQGLRHGGALTAAADVPLIRADERPTKVKPENPGGMEVPDRDKLIYTQKRAAVEHLLPPPEKPMARPGTPPAGDALQPHSGSAALNAAAVTNRLTHVSTAGGAFLESLEGKTLPGVAVLLPGTTPKAARS